MTSSPIRKTMTAADWALLIVLSVVWGGSFLFIGVAVRELPSLTIVALRVTLAALALRLVLAILRMPLPRGRPVWTAFLRMGILNNAIPFTLIVWGQSHIASGLASILNATTPLFTVIAAHYFTTDERLTASRIAGTAVGFLGVAAMIGQGAFQGTSLASNSSLAAQFAVLGAALSYAFAGIYGRRFRGMGIPPLATATGQVIASSALLLPLALLVDRPWTLPVPSPGTALAVGGLALVSTAFAYILFFRLLSRAGATNVGLVTLLIPVSAVAFGALLLGEHLALRHGIGMALIGAGLALIDGRLVSGIGRLLPAERSPLGGTPPSGG